MYYLVPNQTQYAFIKIFNSSVIQTNILDASEQIHGLYQNIIIARLSYVTVNLYDNLVYTVYLGKVYSSVSCYRNKCCVERINEVL